MLLSTCGVIMTSRTLRKTLRKLNGTLSTPSHILTLVALTSGRLAELEILKFAQVPDFWKAVRREDLEGMKKDVEERLEELEEK